MKARGNANRITIQREAPMAASATTAAAAAYISIYNFQSKKRYTSISSSSFPYFGAKKQLIKRSSALSIIKNSTNDVSAPETTENAEPESSSEEAPIEASKGIPSLISAVNVEKALRGIAISDVDHYGTLGLPRKCSYDEVIVAYNKKVEEIKNQGLDVEELNKQLEFLKESYSILSSPEERRLYDWSLARAGNPDTYVWPFEVDKPPIFPEDPPPQEPEDLGPTRLTGYIILGWLMISFVFFVAFNR